MPTYSYRPSVTCEFSHPVKGEYVTSEIAVEMLELLINEADAIDDIEAIGIDVKDGKCQYRVVFPMRNFPESAQRLMKVVNDMQKDLNPSDGEAGND